MSNRTERRRIDRAVKKLQRKEEKKLMKAASNSSQYNSKKSQKLAPHIQTEETEQGELQTILVNKRVDIAPEIPPSIFKIETNTIKMKYAACTGNAIAESFYGKKLIAKCAYPIIAGMTDKDKDLNYVHARTAALIIDNKLITDIAIAIRDSLIMTNFHPVCFMDIMRDFFSDAITDVIVQIMGQVVDDKEFLYEIIPLNVTEEIYNTFAKAVYHAARDDSLYDDIEDAEMYYDGTCSGFSDNYFDYYNEFHLTPEIFLQKMYESEDEDYDTEEYEEECTDEEDKGDDYADEEDKDNKYTDEKEVNPAAIVDAISKIDISDNAENKGKQ